MTHRLALRRLVLGAVTLAAAAAAVWQHARLQATHPLLPYATGWLLFALMLGLTAYNARKKLPFLPLFSSRLWLQLHVYAGLFTAVVYGLHAGCRVPAGWFEGILAALFALVTVSGLVGWWLSRQVPRRLTTVGGEVLYERIPIIRRQLRLQAEAAALQAIPEHGATTLADFYNRDLSAYFAGPQPFWRSIFSTRRRLNLLLGSLAETRRYLTASENANADRLADLIRQKDALDFQRSSQLALKAWLFVHIPLTYALLLYSVVHVVLVYAFSGGAR
ncbi:MAG: hypothetical protein JSR48_13870 [Verrucomicrobia bacterium]|nr:hypothetical protein [Verrucomicrobiota bacterium]